LRSVGPPREVRVHPEHSTILLRRRWGVKVTPAGVPFLVAALRSVHATEGGLVPSPAAEGAAGARAGGWKRRGCRGPEGGGGPPVLRRRGPWHPLRPLSRGGLPLPPRSGPRLPVRPLLATLRQHRPFTRNIVSSYDCKVYALLFHQGIKVTSAFARRNNCDSFQGFCLPVSRRLVAETALVPQLPGPLLRFFLRCERWHVRGSNHSHSSSGW